ncbi:MAG: 50S ribosomal protein L22 [Patescibacteria group bacterium]
MKATLSNFQQSPRKVRLVADLVRGKELPRARTLLAFAEKKSAEALLKLLDSAVSNARTGGVSAEGLFVKDICVNQGISMKRFMPMARGRANPYRHRRSTVVLTLGTKAVSKDKSQEKPVQIVAPKKAKKTSAKRATK